MTGNESGRAVQDDAGAFPLARGAREGDVDRAGPAPDSPERSGAGVAQDRAVTAGEDGGHPPAVIAQSDVTHRMNTTMKGEESVGPHAALDASGRNLEVVELRNRDHTMLAGRELGNQGVRVRFVAFLPHVR
jgi:hypothetical protein